MRLKRARKLRAGRPSHLRSDKSLRSNQAGTERPGAETSPCFYRRLPSLKHLPLRHVFSNSTNILDSVLLFPGADQLHQPISSSAALISASLGAKHLEHKNRSHPAHQDRGALERLSHTHTHTEIITYLLLIYTWTNLIVSFFPKLRNNERGKKAKLLPSEGHTTANYLLFKMFFLIVLTRIFLFAWKVPH